MILAKETKNNRLNSWDNKNEATDNSKEWQKKYRLLGKNIRNKCKQTKNEWFSKNYIDMKTDIAGIYTNIGEIARQNMFSLTGGIKSNKGTFS